MVDAAGVRRRPGRLLPAEGTAGAAHPRPAGGQDGWLNSANFVDQVPLWLEGRYIEMPLREASVRARFRHVTELTP